MTRGFAFIEFSNPKVEAFCIVCSFTQSCVAWSHKFLTIMYIRDFYTDCWTLHATMRTNPKSVYNCFTLRRRLVQRSSRRTAGP